MAYTQPDQSNREASLDLANLPLESLKSELQFSTEGLTRAEAEARLRKYGFNALSEEKTNPILKFLSYFWGPIPWMIEVAAILSPGEGTWQPPPVTKVK